MKEIDLRSCIYSEVIGQRVTPQYHPETGEFCGWGRGHMVYRVLPGVSIGRLIYQGKSINGHGCTFYYDGDEDAYIDASAVEEAKQYIEDMVRTECQPLVDELNRSYPPFGGK